jgi:hypothetical protein
VRISIGHDYPKGLIVLVSADLALGHIYSPLLGAEHFPVSRTVTRDLAGTNARLDGARSLPPSLHFDKIPSTEGRHGAGSDENYRDLLTHLSAALAMTGTAYLETGRRSDP